MNKVRYGETQYLWGLGEMLVEPTDMWIQTSALPSTGSVTSGKSFTLFEP